MKESKAAMLAATAETMHQNMIFFSRASRNSASLHANHDRHKSWFGLPIWLPSCLVKILVRASSKGIASSLAIRSFSMAFICPIMGIIPFSVFNYRPELASSPPVSRSAVSRMSKNESTIVGGLTWQSAASASGPASLAPYTLAGRLHWPC